MIEQERILEYTACQQLPLVDKVPIDKVTGTETLNSQDDYAEIKHRHYIHDGIPAYTPLALPEWVYLQDTKVSLLTLSELHRQIAHTIRRQQKRLILNVNVHCINLCHKHEWLRRFINQAPIVFCDGFGVMLGARLLGHKIPERITYADWLWQLAEFAVENDFSIFCLGAKPLVIEQAMARLQEANPNLNIAGFHHGYFDKTPGSAQNQAVIDLINQVQPDILLVGFGMPLQERWLHDCWQEIDANVALTGGAVFDYVSGDLKRAPAWVLKMNMEWVGRLLIEPRRLSGRYLVGNPLFMLRILKELVSCRWTHNHLLSLDD